MPQTARAADTRTSKSQRSTPKGSARTKAVGTTKANSAKKASSKQPRVGNRKTGNRKAIKPKLTARAADKHELYESSVQDPQSDVRFLHRVFLKERGRTPVSLREDFCGTAFLCSEWVRSRKERTAVGVDLSAETQEWGRRKHLAPLGEAAQRVQLLTEDVLEVKTSPSDVVVAFNFSYCIFLERQTMLRYFQRCRQALKKDGLFAVDIHGGPEALVEMKEETRHSQFTYIWDQGPVDALSHKSRRAIHYRFKDGTQMKNAFTYEWRVWSLPELRDLMIDAGFSRVEVYWEGFDENGDGNGIFRKVQKAENDDSWIAYVLGWK